jgi:hypothetical protein
VPIVDAIGYSCNCGYYLTGVVICHFYIEPPQGEAIKKITSGSNVEDRIQWIGAMQHNKCFSGKDCHEFD